MIRTPAQRSGGDAVVDQFDGGPSAQPPADALIRLRAWTRTGTPPAAAGAPADTPFSYFGDEPTQTLPVIAAASPAPPSQTPPAPVVAARAVIVYQPEPRRPWRLWVFTAVLVALTVGVVLGQTVAFQPTFRSSANAQAGEVPTFGTPVPSVPSPPVAGQRVTAPLGSAKTRLFEVVGDATALHIRSANLGNLLFSITAVDHSAVPKLVNTARGPQLELVRTDIGGTVGADIVLNAKVSWTVRLAGRSTEQDIDMRTGGLAGVELAGGASRVTLELPKPKGTASLSVTAAVQELDIQAAAGTPVRLRLGKGASVATVDGTTFRTVKPGTALTSAGWKSARNRYDVATSATVNSASVDHR
jgi:hypothetical protein